MVYQKIVSTYYRIESYQVFYPFPPACQLLKPKKSKVMLYLAAAVSDFYLPASDMMEHKIQSSEGAPKIELKLVPKILAPLVSDWIPQAFVISFKLETDESILIKKANKALETYKHKIVIANLLQTRKEKVILVMTSTSADSPNQLETIVMSKQELISGLSYLISNYSLFKKHYICYNALLTY